MSSHFFTFSHDARILVDDVAGIESAASFKVRVLQTKIPKAAKTDEFHVLVHLPPVKPLNLAPVNTNKAEPFSLPVSVFVVDAPDLSAYSSATTLIVGTPINVPKRRVRSSAKQNQQIFRFPSPGFASASVVVWVRSLHKYYDNTIDISAARYIQLPTSAVPTG